MANEQLALFVDNEIGVQGEVKKALHATGSNVVVFSFSIEQQARVNHDHTVKHLFVRLELCFCYYSSSS